MECSLHREFLSDMDDYFKKIRCVDSRGRITRPPCFNGWRLSINTLLQFFEDLRSEGVEYLRTRNLNQYCLENLFGIIRRLGGNNCYPTPDKFRLAFKHVMLSDALRLKSVDRIGSNPKISCCEHQTFNNVSYGKRSFKYYGAKIWD